MQRLLWPFRGMDGELAAGCLTLADLVLWLCWFMPMLHFRSLPGAAAIVWSLGFGLAFVRRYSLSASLVGSRRHVSPRAGFGSASIVAVAAAAVAFATFGRFWNVVYGRVPGVAPPPDGLLEGPGATTHGLIAATLVLVLVGPVMEEICFRGWMLPTLTRRYGTAAGVALSSLLFAAAHAHPLWIPYHLVLGAALAVAVLATGSVWTGVAMHAGHNLLALALTPVFPTPESMASWMDGPMPGEASAILGMLSTGGVLILLALRQADRAASRA